MSVDINAREVLKYLNELGYCEISSRQLKEFIKDLKILIKYDQRMKYHEQNQENIHPVSSESSYYSVHREQNEPQYDFNTGDVATEINTQRDEQYLSDIFNTLHCASTVSSRAKSKTQNEDEQNVISVQILKPKPSRPFSSSCTTSETNRNEPQRRHVSCSLVGRNKDDSSDFVSEPQFPESSRSGMRPKSSQVTLEKQGRHTLKPKVSFIRPRKPIKVSKSDPVALYQQYQEEWRKQKLPGEDKRYHLRWSIRERMLGEPDIMPRKSLEKISRKSNRS